MEELIFLPFVDDGTYFRRPGQHSLPHFHQCVLDFFEGRLNNFAAVIDKAVSLPFLGYLPFAASWYSLFCSPTSKWQKTEIELVSVATLQKSFRFGCFLRYDKDDYIS